MICFFFLKDFGIQNFLRHYQAHIGKIKSDIYIIIQISIKSLVNMNICTLNIDCKAMHIIYH